MQVTSAMCLFYLRLFYELPALPHEYLQTVFETAHFIVLK